MSKEFRQQFMPDLDLDGPQFASVNNNSAKKSVSNCSDSSANSTIFNSNGEIEGTIFPEIIGLRTSHYANLVPVEASGLGQPAMLPHFQHQSLITPEGSFANVPSSVFGSPYGILDSVPSRFQSWSQMPIKSSGEQLCTPIPFESDVKSKGEQNEMSTKLTLQSLSENNGPSYKKQKIYQNGDVDTTSHTTVSPDKEYLGNQSGREKVFSDDKHELLMLRLQKEEQKESLIDHAGNPVDLRISGSLFGGFSFKEDQLENSDPTQVPISCYRRNFIILDICLGASECPKYVVLKDGSRKELQKIQVDILARSNFSNTDIPIVLFDPMISHNSKFGKLPKTVASVPHISVRPFKGRHMMIFNRFQFKRATPNNGKSTPGNYFYITVKLNLVISSDDGEEKIPYGKMRSNNISVRGRSPTFYNKRHDVSILKDVTDFSWDLLQRIPVLKRDKMQSIDRDAIKPSVNRVGIGMRTTNRSTKKTLKPRYKYIPISSSYYLPPIRPYYLPHSAAHREGKSDHLHMRQFTNANKYNFFIRKKINDPAV